MLLSVEEAARPQGSFDKLLAAWDAREVAAGWKGVRVNEGRGAASRESPTRLSN